MYGPVRSRLDGEHRAAAGLTPPKIDRCSGRPSGSLGAVDLSWLDAERPSVSDLAGAVACSRPRGRSTRRTSGRGSSPRCWPTCAFGWDGDPVRMRRHQGRRRAADRGADRRAGRMGQHASRLAGDHRASPPPPPRAGQRAVQGRRRRGAGTRGGRSCSPTPGRTRRAFPSPRRWASSGPAGGQAAAGPRVAGPRRHRRTGRTGRGRTPWTTSSCGSPAPCRQSSAPPSPR